jgi:mannose-1-phosphate guanylyltransferase/phosphomannomutase
MSSELVAHEPIKTAVILAGGQGTRLRPLTDELPKPLLPVGHRPLLEHILWQLAQHGVQRIILATGYRAEQIQKYFDDGARWNISLRYVIEDEPLGSGGALRFVQEQCGDWLQEPFWVTNADVLNSADLSAAARQHQTRGACATIVCGRVDDPTGFGVCEMAKDGRVSQWVEKPAPGTICSCWANSGWWIFEPHLLQQLQPGFSRIEDTLFPQLLSDDQPLYAFCHDGYWLDVGTLERYAQAQEDAELGRFALAP